MSPIYKEYGWTRANLKVLHIIFPFTKCQPLCIHQTVSTFTDLAWRVTREHVLTIIWNENYKLVLQNVTHCHIPFLHYFQLMSTVTVFYGYLFVQVGTEASIRPCNMHKTICQPADFICLRARKQKYRYCSSIFNDSSTTRGGKKGSLKGGCERPEIVEAVGCRMESEWVCECVCL